MTKLPEFVYLVTVDTEWPISVVVDYGNAVADDVARVVDQRGASANVYQVGQVHVWKARLSDIREVDLMPSVTTRPALRERSGD